MTLAFWLALALLVYTYLGYGAVMTALARLRRWLAPRPDRPVPADADLPPVTLLIAAYNEADILDEKLTNIRSLRYPKEKLTVLFVTDGSSDASPERLRHEPDVQVLHRPERRGKIHAMHRAMKHVQTPITVFSDANAMLNPDALRNLVRHYQDPTVGAVAGEKRVQTTGDSAAGAGEGLYWRYESFLKRMDAEVHSAVGAAGELFSIRTALFRPVAPDTLLDDFMLTLRIAADGFRIAYAPDAYAEEAPSASMADEMKRKVRIAAGGFQSIMRLPELWNPLRHGWLSFQYISHRVLRWTLAPAVLPVVLGLNVWLAAESGGLYTILLGLQGAFYGLAGYGALTHNCRRGPGVLYAPFYFLAMNAAMYRGFYRFLKGRQRVQWEKARRAVPA